MIAFFALSDRGLQHLLLEARSKIPCVDLSSLAARRAARHPALLVDVREAHEFREGHIEGAVNAPRSLLESEIERIAPSRDTPLLLYCQGGTRAALAAVTLAEMGYTRVERADEGFTAWLARGLPVARPAGSSALSAAQRQRYLRHALLPEVGEEGQRRLLEARVLLVGVGGLGSPVALYLAAAGVGTLGLVDHDTVELSNLQRQVVHASHRVGHRKVDSAGEALAAINRDVAVVRHPYRLSAENVDALLVDYDLVVDGSDNFATRYLLNDASIRHQKPVAHGSVYRFEGQATLFAPGEGPCYRCLYPEPPPPELAPSCQEAGVLGVLPGLIGMIQATEVMKRVLGLGDSLVGRLLTYDALEMSFREMRYRRDPECPSCGERPRLIRDLEGYCEGGSSDKR